MRLSNWFPLSRYPGEFIFLVVFLFLHEYFGRDEWNRATAAAGAERLLTAKRRRRHAVSDAPDAATVAVAAAAAVAVAVAGAGPGPTGSRHSRLRWISVDAIAVGNGRHVSFRFRSITLGSAFFSSEPDETRMATPRETERKGPFVTKNPMKPDETRWKLESSPSEPDGTRWNPNGDTNGDREKQWPFVTKKPGSTRWNPMKPDGSSKIWMIRPRIELRSTDATVGETGPALATDEAASTAACPLDCNCRGGAEAVVDCRAIGIHNVSAHLLRWPLPATVKLWVLSWYSIRKCFELDWSSNEDWYVFFSNVFLN